MGELNDIKLEFKSSSLAIPDPAPREVQNAKPYDFSPPDFESLSAINHLVAGVGST
jgi:hypothetical protein